MVRLADIRSSLKEFKPKSDKFKYVAIFVGGTSGIGEAAIKSFAANVSNAQVFVIGRNREAATTIMAQSKHLSPSSHFQFIQQDLSLIKDVDRVCKEIAKQAVYVDLLFMTQGYLSSRARNGIVGIPLTFRYLLISLLTSEKKPVKESINCFLSATMAACVSSKTSFLC
jgi:NAD(P)-dependent dehydrogenase (short-subunit alcohol dehydrogenase family)